MTVAFPKSQQLRAVRPIDKIKYNTIIIVIRHHGNRISNDLTAPVPFCGPLGYEP